MQVPAHEPLEELETKVNLKAYSSIRDRLRAVILARQGDSAGAIAQRLDRHIRWVQTWVYRYRDRGLIGLQDRPRPGQPTRLDRQKQAAFQARVVAGVRPEDRVCRLGGPEIQRILQEEFDADYSLGGVYRLLHRLGCVCLCPRPRHQKHDPAAVAQWQAEAPFLSKPSPNSTRIRPWRSGMRMNAGSASKDR